MGFATLDPLSVNPDSGIRRNTTISVDFPPDVPGDEILVIFTLANVTELACLGGVWLPPYTESRIVAIKNDGEEILFYRYQIKRTGGWTSAPDLSAYKEV